VDWLREHLVTVSLPEDGSPLRVIAWKDPTLEPAAPKVLAGYLITDTLWAAKALKPIDPARSSQIEAGLQRVGWYGNGLHEVLFHGVDPIRHRPLDEDLVHGLSLWRLPIQGGQTVDVRVLRQAWDSDYTVGHPLLFTEHAVYQAMYDFWKGRRDQACRRILNAITDERAARSDDHTFWDDQAGVLVDHVTYEDWLAFRGGKSPSCRHYSFKLGVLLYAVRFLDLEQELGPRLDQMRRRLWDAQTLSGGIAHFVDVSAEGEVKRASEPTGEASAIAILAETVAGHGGAKSPVTR
jgi:hypothetical protein